MKNAWSWKTALLPLSIALFCFLLAGITEAHAATAAGKKFGAEEKINPSLCVYIQFSQGSLTDKRSVGDREDKLIEECHITSKQAGCLFDDHPKDEVGSVSDLIEACKI